GSNFWNGLCRFCSAEGAWLRHRAAGGPSHWFGSHRTWFDCCSWRSCSIRVLLVAIIRCAADFASAVETTRELTCSHLTHKTSPRPRIPHPTFLRFLLPEGRENGSSLPHSKDIGKLDRR